MNTISTPMPHMNQDSSVDFAGFMQELWGHKWLLLATTILGLTLGVFYALRQPAIYQSNVLLQIDMGKGASSGTSFADQLLSGGATGDSAATQVALIQSRFILEPVVESLGLAVRITEKPTHIKERLFPWLYRKNINIRQFSVPKAMINHPYLLKVERPGQVALYDKDSGELVLSGTMGEQLTNETKELSLAIEHTDLPADSQFEIVQRTGDAMVKSLLGQLKVEDVGRGTRFGGTGVLELTLKGKSKEKVPQILNAIAYTARSKDAEKKSQEASQTLAFLEQQLPVSKQLLEAAEQKLNAYRAESGKIDIKIQTEFLLNQLAGLDKQLNELEIKAIEMRQRYKKIHPIWIALETQISALKQQRSSLEQQIKALPASDQVAVNLMRDVDVKQSLYMLLLNKIQELKVVRAGTVSSVRILSNALLPQAPIPSKGRFIVLAGTLLGFMLGLAYIFGRQLFSQHVDDPHWSEKQLSLPNVAIVPFSKEQVDAAMTTLKGSLPLLSHSHPKNLAIEALRSLRTSLQVTLACAENNVISILGVSPNIGKSFISVNLSYLLAAAGKRVLLIDSDLRKGTVHKYFSLKPSPGLSEVLMGEESIQSVLMSTMHPNLTVVRRGQYPKDPAELLSGQAFRNLIDGLATQYDIVLFDTAPVLLVTDAVLVSAFSATNFLVMGAGVHQPSEVELVCKRLRHAEVHVNGTIFNFHKEKMRNYYNGKYYYNNAYAYYHDETEKLSS